MSGATSGTGNYVDINPGASRYFRTKATSSAFISNIQSLAAPARPSAPSFQIDYIKEETSTPIDSDYAYGLTSDLSDATQGSGNAVKITPGVNTYLQARASSSAFASEIQTLVSPSRSAAPSVGLDFTNETTDISISPVLQYSGSSGFETPKNGTGVALDLIPSVDLYFRNSATVSTYSSEVFLLVVPERPVVSSVESGTTTLYPFIATFTFSQVVSSLDNASVSVVNADLKNLGLSSGGSNETVFEGLVYATATDVISISVPANTALEGNFVSNTFEVFYSGQLPGVGIESRDLSSFAVYPNPGKGVFHMKFENFDAQASYKVECCSITGEVVHTETFYGVEDLRMDLSDLSDGFYLLRLTENDKVTGVVKLIIK